MSKYDPLKQYLDGCSNDAIELSFEAIESLLGIPLPPSARKHRPWWSNNATNSVATRAWLDAGFKTEAIDMVTETVVFRRIADPARRSLKATAAVFSRTIPFEKAYGALAGTIVLHGDIGLEQPTGESWNADI